MLEVLIGKKYPVYYGFIIKQRKNRAALFLNENTAQILPVGEKGQFYIVDGMGDAAFAHLQKEFCIS
ncbi:MAG: hypothetical protein HFF11_06145 [Angelakisella sp.]|jgi:hypothetical protein|nr:hypothetical protein [Angelakisella sp.]